MGHRETRNGYENCNIGVFSKEHTAGKYDIPLIQPLHELDCKEFIGFDANKEKHLDKGIHFFLHDYQFDRVWRSLGHYTDILSRHPCVFAPDFSPYADFPKIIQTGFFTLCRLPENHPDLQPLPQALLRGLLAVARPDGGAGDHMELSREL